MIINYLGPSIFGKIIFYFTIIKLSNLIFGVGIIPSFRIIWFKQKLKIGLIGSALQLQIFTSLILFPGILISKLLI